MNVFISYAHHSPTTKTAVSLLVDSLTQSGITITWDQNIKSPPPPVHPKFDINALLPIATKQLIERVNNKGMSIVSIVANGGIGKTPESIVCHSVSMQP